MWRARDQVPPNFHLLTCTVSHIRSHSYPIMLMMVLLNACALRRLSKICCVRVLSVAENESVGLPVQNFVSFFKIIEIRLIQSVISSRGHSKMRRYALNGGGEPTKAHKNVQRRGCSLKKVRMPVNCSKSVFSQCSLIFLSVS